MSIFTTNDIATLRSDRLILAAQAYFDDYVPTDLYLMQEIRAAEAETSRLLRVLLEPTQLFSYMPSDDEIAALNGMPWLDEPGYDYSPDFFRGDSWGYIVTRQRPIIAVQLLQFAYPNPQTGFYQIPLSWLRLDRKYGHIRLVPASQAFTAPLNAFLLQALGGGQIIPSMLQVNYTAGLTDARNQWPDLVDVILKKAVLKVIEGGFFPASASIGADGLTQSMSIDMSKYDDRINAILFGPKGSNGGLWTAIHGIVGTALGVVA